DQPDRALWRDHPFTCLDNGATPVQDGRVLRRDFAYAQFSTTIGEDSTDLVPTGLFTTHSSSKGTTSGQRQDRHRNPSADIHVGYQYSPVPGERPRRAARRPPPAYCSDAVARKGDRRRRLTGRAARNDSGTRALLDDRLRLSQVRDEP